MSDARRSTEHETYGLWSTLCDCGVRVVTLAAINTRHGQARKVELDGIPHQCVRGLAPLPRLKHSPPARKPEKPAARGGVDFL